jgi:hypothetical protein
MEIAFEWWMSIAITILAYLLGMAFAGSFLGRKWMGAVDIFLHKVFRREVTIGKYLYWKHFCNINAPPKPLCLVKPKNFTERFLLKFIT